MFGMFGKSKKKKDDKEIAESALGLWQFIQAVLMFVEEDPNRVRSFLKVMYKAQHPTKEDVNETRKDMTRSIAFISQTINLTQEKLEGK